MTTFRIASGQTIPGNTAWQEYLSSGTPPVPTSIQLEVDTTSGQFTTVPKYFTSLGGAHHHWEIVGSTAIYNPSATSFHVYIKWVNNAPLDATYANYHEWHINWIGIEG